MSSEVKFPSLGAPYEDALRSCVEMAFREYDVVAIVASGTIIRGTPDRRSDLDIHVLHRGNFRERVQAWHCGVPVEMFVNPPHRIPKYFEGDAADRRPMTPHMFATGVILFDTDAIAAKLVEQAKEVIANSPEGRSVGLYGAATMFEDADDLAERDPEAAALILGQAVYDLAHARISKEPGWTPRAKDLLNRLREADPESARLLVKATGSAPLTERIEAARQLCIRVAGTDGFFEWRSPREEIAN